MNKATLAAQFIFRQQGGMLSTSEAMRLKIAPRTLYALRDSGTLTEVARGLYRLAELPPLSEPDLVIAARKIPKGVICLISALAYHELTTQIPHVVHVALPMFTEKPRLVYPPLKFYWISGKAYSAGIETHSVDGASLRIYDPEKTMADCFKFRNKVGLDVTLEALKRCSQRPEFRLDRLLAYARLDRVSKVMQPYLEMLT
jgi:predicted transcriptional regulator of viral defense system